MRTHLLWVALLVPWFALAQKAPKTVNTKSDLVAAAPILFADGIVPPGSTDFKATVIVRGITNANDGLGGIFIWDAANTNAATTTNYFQFGSTNPGRWIRMAMPGSSGGGVGDMLKSVYDTDADNVVDNAEQIQSTSLAALLLKAVYDADADNVVDNSEALGGTAASGWMLKSLYDADLDGVVDSSESLSGQSLANVLSRANHTGTQPLSSLAQSGATSGQVATWNGAAWAPSTVSGGGGGGDIVNSVTNGLTGATALTGILVGHGVNAITGQAAIPYGWVTDVTEGAILGRIPGMDDGPAHAIPIGAGLAFSSGYLVATGGSGGSDITNLTGIATGRLVGNTGGSGNGEPISVTAPLSLSGGALSVGSGDLAALEALSGTGVSVRTGTSTWTTRTIAVGTGLSVADGTGVSGNPTISATGELAALAGLSSTGIVARIGTADYGARTITAGNGISVANGDGNAGNPVITAAGASYIVQTYTSSGTWTNPPNSILHIVRAIGGGGGGSSGRKGSSASNRSGGPGGTHAGYAERILPNSIVGATETVTVGSGGAGGAAVTADNTNGNPGANGGISSFGSLVRAYYGNGGATPSGTSLSGRSAALSWAPATEGGPTDVSATPAAPAAGLGGSGGGGGSIDSGNAAQQPAAGGTAVGGGASITGGSAGTSTSASGTPTAGTAGGNTTTGEPSYGSGGGGGGSTRASGEHAAAGGNGGLYGGGGGGGGAGVNGGSNSGAGGNGGAGIVQVISILKY